MSFSQFRRKPVVSELSPPWPKKIVLPSFVAEMAICHAQMDPEVEACGFFVWKWEVEQVFGRSEHFVRVSYLKAENVAQDKNRASEIEAEWISKVILDWDWNLLALFHSHPLGDARPSDQRGGDYDSFPHWYVSNALVWGHKTPDQFAVYGEEPGFFEFVHKEKVEIDVRKSL